MTDPLPSWNAGSPKEAIIRFVRQTCGDDGTVPVPVEERVAVFDNDGTLWCEKPMPIQLDFVLLRLVEMAERDDGLRFRQPWLRAAAGQEDVLVRVEPGLRSVVEDRWREASRASGGGDLEAMRTVDPELVDKETVVLGAALRGVFAQLPGVVRWWSATARPTRRPCSA
jgi:hypothetical protein